MSWVRVLLSTSCPGYELSWVRVVLGTSCPGYESSWVRVVLGTSCPGYELSWVLDPNAQYQGRRQYHETDRSLKRLILVRPWNLKISHGRLAPGLREGDSYEGR